MRNNRTTKTRHATAVRSLAVAGATGLLIAALPPSIAAAAGQTWVVHAGESIQKAVDEASSGDVIKIEAGTYREAVCVVEKGLTVQGAGRDSTIIAVPNPLPDTDCWDPGAPEGQAVENVSALKFLNPKGPVRVTDLQTTGHPESGIVAWGADGFTVTRTKGVGHGTYGILATAGTTNIVISNNVEQGVEVNRRSGTAGISVGDSANANARIVDNQSQGWNLGIFVREARGGRVANNTVSGNCVGILVFDDTATERPTTDNYSILGGDWKVENNRSTANNRLCFAGRDGSLVVSGVGMSIVNADDVLVAGNTITGNVPASNATNFPPAGLSLLTVPSPTPTPTGDPFFPGPAENVRVVGNTIRNNVPFDILLGSAGGGISFVGNSCGTSNPPSICGS